MKNGTTRRGKQNYKCRDCGRQFVENPQWKRREPDSTAMIDRLLVEKIPLAGIARVLKLSASWLQRYVKRCDELVPHQGQVLPNPKGSLTVQMDELWSFVCLKFLGGLNSLVGAMVIRIRLPTITPSVYFGEVLGLEKDETGAIDITGLNAKQNSSFLTCNANHRVIEACSFPLGDRELIRRNVASKSD